MTSDRRAFLRMAGAAVIAGPAVRQAKGQSKAKVFLPPLVGLRHEGWHEADEKPGKELIVESVGVSPSQRVGASKRGTRKIIPITGGLVPIFEARVDSAAGSRFDLPKTCCPSSPRTSRRRSNTGVQGTQGLAWVP